MPKGIKRDILHSRDIGHQDHAEELYPESEHLIGNINKREKAFEHKRNEKIKNQFAWILMSINLIVFIFIIVISVVYLWHVTTPESLRWLDRRNGLEKIELIFITITVNLCVSIVLKNIKTSGERSNIPLWKQ